MTALAGDAGRIDTVFAFIPRRTRMIQGLVHLQKQKKDTFNRYQIRVRDTPQTST